jgi:hypothetical protein
MIGAAGGAVAGAAIGSIIPGVGTLIGGLIGGVVGGGGGGFIGPGKKSQYAYQGVGTSNGRLVLMPLMNQSMDAAPLVAANTQTVANTNNFLDQYGINASSALPVITTGSGALAGPASVADSVPWLRFSSSQGGDLGQAVNKSIQDVSFKSLDDLQAAVKTASDFVTQTMQPLRQYLSADPNLYLSSGYNGTQNFGDLRFSSNVGGDMGDAIHGAIEGKSFGSMDELQAAVAQAETFVNQTMPTLIQQGQAALDAATKKGVSIWDSYQTSIDSVNATYQAAIDQAKSLGVAEGGLVDARDKALQAIDVQRKAASEAAYNAINQNIYGFQLRYEAASGILDNNNLGTAKHVALENFDVQAQQQRDQFSAQLVAALGDAYKTSATYADQMGQLERALGEERLVVAKQYDDQIATQAAQAAAEQAAIDAQNRDKATQAATSVMQNIANYAANLQTSDKSPLSVQDQYALASQQFNAVGGAAAAGDANSLSQLTSYADELLTASRAINGSGTGYVADYQRVLDILDRVGKITPDTLTASFLASETRTQTATLVDALKAIEDQVKTLNQRLLQGSNAPSRVAA